MMNGLNGQSLERSQKAKTRSTLQTRASIYETINLAGLKLNKLVKGQSIIDLSNRNLLCKKSVKLF